MNWQIVSAAAGCVFAVSAGAARCDVVAANNIPDDWTPSSFRGDIGYSAPNFPNTADAQYFLASAGGRVTTITSPIRQGFNGPTGAPLRVAIHHAVGAVGSSVPGAIIGSVMVGSENFPPFNMVTLVTMDFSAANVDLEAGQAYHLVLTTDVPVPGGSQYSDAWLNVSPLNFGQSPNFSPNEGGMWRPPVASIPNELGVRVMVGGAPPCPADWNQDGVANSQDFFDFLTALLSGENADFNHNGVTDSQDLFDFIVAFFAGC